MIAVRQAPTRNMAAVRFGGHSPRNNFLSFGGRNFPVEELLLDVLLPVSEEEMRGFVPLHEGIVFLFGLLSQE